MISGNENEAENKKIDHKDTTEIDLELGMNKNMINIYMKKLSNTEAELRKALLIKKNVNISNQQKVSFALLELSSAWIPNRYFFIPGEFTYGK